MQRSKDFRFWVLLALTALVGFLVLALIVRRPRPHLALEVLSINSNQWLQISITNTLRSSIRIFGNEDLDFGVYIEFCYDNETVSAKTGGRPSYIVDLLPGGDAKRRLQIPAKVKYVNATVRYYSKAWPEIAYDELSKRGYAKCADIVSRCERMWPSTRSVSTRIEIDSTSGSLGAGNARAPASHQPAVHAEHE